MPALDTNQTQDNSTLKNETENIQDHFLVNLELTSSFDGIAIPTLVLNEASDEYEPQ